MTTVAVARQGLFPVLTGGRNWVGHKTLKVNEGRHLQQSSLWLSHLENSLCSQEREKTLLWSLNLDVYFRVGWITLRCPFSADLSWPPLSPGDPHWGEWLPPCFIQAEVPLQKSTFGWWCLQRCWLCLPSCNHDCLRGYFGALGSGLNLLSPVTGSFLHLLLRSISCCYWKCSLHPTASIKVSQAQ